MYNEKTKINLGYCKYCNGQLTKFERYRRPLKIKSQLYVLTDRDIIAEVSCNKCDAKFIAYIYGEQLCDLSAVYGQTKFNQFLSSAKNESI